MRSQSLLLEITVAVIRGRLVGKDLRVGYVGYVCAMGQLLYVGTFVCDFGIGSSICY